MLYLSVCDKSAIAQPLNLEGFAAETDCQKDADSAFLDILNQNIGSACNLNLMSRGIASILVDYSLGLAGIFCG